MLQSSPNSDDDSEIPAPTTADESMFSISYDPLEQPNQMTLERDLEDFLMERSTRFYDASTALKKEKCYLVGLEDRSLNERDDMSRFSLEESMTELSELAGAAGVMVVGSTYQRVARPSIEYYIGPGKLKDIRSTMQKLKCTCVVFDVELSPAQQKNLELSFNQEKSGDRVKVLDRTALILDIFAQHARTKEGITHYQSTQTNTLSSSIATHHHHLIHTNLPVTTLSFHRPAAGAASVADLPSSSTDQHVESLGTTSGRGQGS